MVAGLGVAKNASINALGYVGERSTVRVLRSASIEKSGTSHTRMKVFKLPIPNDELASDCDNCHELPARIRLVIGGHVGEKLCAACIGVLSMEISEIFEELLKDFTVN